jgi:hypothetical protein
MLSRLFFYISHCLHLSVGICIYIHIYIHIYVYILYTGLASRFALSPITGESGGPSTPGLLREFSLAVSSPTLDGGTGVVILVIVILVIVIVIS